MSTAGGPMIVFLDLARVTGWAAGRPGDVPALGTEEFAEPGEDHEAIFLGCARFTEKLIRHYRPDYFFMEEPMPPASFSRKTPMATALVLYGVVAVAGMIARAQHVRPDRIRFAAVQTCRKHFTGRGVYPGGRDEAKRASLTRAKALGWPVKTLDEADAAAGWDYACAYAEPRIHGLNALGALGAASARA